jgi:hypothetical protein
MDDLEQLWESLLSSDRARIRRAWLGLTDDEAQSVLAHLTRMRDEAGWDPTQRDAATFALQVLFDQAQ